MEANKQKQKEESFSIKDLLWISLSKWYLFVISVIVCCGVAYYYTLRTPNTYLRTAKLLIKDDRMGGTSGGDVGSSFTSMAILQPNTNVDNEIVALHSPALMFEVVDRLNLDVNYSKNGTFHDTVLYGSTLPVQLRFLDMPDEAITSLVMNVNKDGSGTLTHFVTGDDDDGNPVYDDTVVKFTAHVDTIDTPVGKITHRPNAAYAGVSPAITDIKVSRGSKVAAANDYATRLGASTAETYSTIIDLSFTDVSADRAADVLSTVIEVYNENWIRDKNQIAVSTSNFINERLQVIEQELGSVDSDISSYRSEHLIPDVASVAQAYFQRTTEASDEVQAINNKLGVARYVREFLNNSANNANVLPANTGLQDVSIEGQIASYNTKLLQRNNLLTNSSANNPIVVSLESELAGIRQSIIAAIDNYIVTLNAALRAAQSAHASSASRLAANPSQAKYLLSVERQQKVKESLYLFLLQKREENELSQAFTAYNTSTIGEPDGLSVPTFPSSTNIMLIALALGLAIPAIILILREMLDTKIRGRRDLASLSIPYVGEIPSAVRKPRGLERLKKVRVVPNTIVVEEACRNSINEAFRVLRTNLEYLGETDGQASVNADTHNATVIAVTSANAGSGKTFISVNLGKVLAIKGKKTLIIDLDIRKASLSGIVGRPETGITEYLIGKADAGEIIHAGAADTAGLDVIAVGTVPPNPSELLSSHRLDQLIHKMKSEYDYIILDCPPVEIVTDAKIINRLADITLFVVRAGLLEKDELPDIQEYYDRKRYKNMAILLNGTDIRSGYGYHRYGYHYGYHYGNYGNYGSKS